MGSSRDILPRHTKSGKQPNIAPSSLVNPSTRLSNAYMQHWDGKQWKMIIWPTFSDQLTEEASVELTDVSGIPDGGDVITVGSSVVFTQNPPIDDAAHNPAQPLVLVSCH